MAEIARTGDKDSVREKEMGKAGLRGEAQRQEGQVERLERRDKDLGRGWKA